MRQIINSKFIPYLSFIVGVAICTSTSMLSIAYSLLAFLILFHNDLYHTLKEIVRKYPVVAGCLLFYSVFLVGCFWSVANTYEIAKMLIKVIGYLLAPLFFLGLQTGNCAKLFIRGFILSATLSALLSILSLAFNTPILHGIADGHWVVFHGHILHNVFIALASVFLLNEVFDNKLDKSLRVYYFIAYLICFIDVIFIVNGRTGQLMLIAMDIFLVIYRFRFRGVLGLLLLSIILVPLIKISPAIQKGIEDYNQDSLKYAHGDPMTSMGLRREFHQKSLEIFKQKPVLGYGTGSFARVYRQHTSFTGVRATTNPHCDFLWIAVELGLFGALGYVAFIVLSIINIFRLDSASKGVGLSIILGYLFASVQNSFFIDNLSGFAFIFIVLSIVAMVNKPQNNY